MRGCKSLVKQSSSMIVSMSSVTSSSSSDHQNPRRKDWFFILIEPYKWIEMLSSQLNPTFILGIIIVHGLCHGFSTSSFRVAVDYYWKDVRKLQPFVAQLYMGMYYIPWIMKPIWGILTDIFPVKGYRRRPYFVLAGVIGVVSALSIALDEGLAIMAALTCLIGVSASIAISEVAIDACVARNSIEFRSLAADLQSLCGFCSSAGALLGYSTTGFFVHHLGAQGSLALLAFPPALVIMLGFVIYEPKITGFQYEKKQAMNNMALALKGMNKTIRSPQVWKPTMFIFLALALSISTHEGHFYWYTSPEAGPGFSQEVVGIIYAIGAMASIVGVVIYQKILKHLAFRSIIFYAQLLFSLSGMLDLMFILRWNLILGIPDYFFVVIEESATRVTQKIRWMPMMVLSSQLCPLGIEGTFFALLMSIDSFGALFSKWVGGLVLQFFHVTRTDFTNLWLAVLVRNVLRLGTLGLIFLVPKVHQATVLLPSDLPERKMTNDAAEENFQLITINPKEVHI